MLKDLERKQKASLQFKTDRGQPYYTPPTTVLREGKW